MTAVFGYPTLVWRESFWQYTSSAIDRSFLVSDASRDVSAVHLVLVLTAVITYVVGTLHFASCFGRHFVSRFGRHFASRFGRHFASRFGRLFFFFFTYSRSFSRLASTSSLSLFPPSEVVMDGPLRWKSGVVGGLSRSLDWWWSPSVHHRW
jgi:hypothetical protein